jgi:quercetin dioxygenase-like cupin family protein
MREHRAPAPGSVVVLAGRVAFLADGEPARSELAPGALALFAGGLPHAVEALEDAAYLVTIGGRERPHGGA